MTYGLRPWELDGLTRPEWNAVCADGARRKAAENEEV